MTEEIKDLVEYMNSHLQHLVNLESVIYQNRTYTLRKDRLCRLIEPWIGYGASAWEEVAVLTNNGFVELQKPPYTRPNQ